MSDSTTFVLLVAAAVTAGGIYMFDRNAKARYHSQPKFTQMNTPGSYFKPPTASTQTDNSFKLSSMDLPITRVQLMSGKTFFG